MKTEFYLMNKYEQLEFWLNRSGTGKMTCYGDSMVPILYSGCELTFVKQEDYEVGDIVFCLVNNHWVDAHKIIEKDDTKGYLISGNNGHIDGWTHTIFGRVVKAEYKYADKPTKVF
jgi:SOS-response transcriptional repressor LexA